MCSSRKLRHFYEDTSQQYAATYYQCEKCRLIFASRRDLPEPKEEFERYETHENDPADKGYRDFLGQLMHPMNRLLEKGSKGLDFGSGPGPTLDIMFEERGHEMKIYDPFYADNPAVFEDSYDFITATEVAEHLFHPGKEFERLWRCLRSGGYLGIMTKIAPDDRDRFADWHYRLDITHVTFYTGDTFQWMADHWSASMDIQGSRVVIFQKP